MCPARVENQEGKTVCNLLPGVLLDENVPGYEDIIPSDKDYLKYHKTYGTAGGFLIHLLGMENVGADVNPITVTQLSKHPFDISLEKGNVWKLPGGTRIVPECDIK